MSRNFKIIAWVASGIVAAVCGVGCIGTALPGPSKPRPGVSASVPPGSWSPATPSPAGSPSPMSATTPPVDSGARPLATKPAADRSGVTPGAFCSEEGSTGRSAKGVVYTCQGPGKLRWRR